MNIAIISTSEKQFKEVYESLVKPEDILEKTYKYCKDKNGNEYYYVNYICDEGILIGKMINKIIDVSPVSINTVYRYYDLSKAVYQVGGIEFIVKE